MQYLLLPGPLPVPTDVVDVVAGRLRAAESVTGYLGPNGADQVFAHEMGRFDQAAVLVRVPVNPFGNRSSVLGRVPVFVRVHAYAAADVRGEGYDPRRYIARIHERIDAQLRGLRFQIDGAKQAFPLFRWEDPGVPEYLDDHKAFWAASTYRTDLFPAAID